MTTEQQGLVLVNQAMEVYKAETSNIKAKVLEKTSSKDKHEDTAIGLHAAQAGIAVNRFASTIESMSWDIVDTIFDKVFKEQVARCKNLMKLLNSKKGTWRRGGKSIYKVVGKGKGEYQYNFVNIANGHTTSVNLGTILSKWVHNP